eukprot:symbB.v1.2.027813.t1/scaffold2876.1/size118008/1
MEKSAQTQHGLWVENMIRAGLETMCIEHLKDDYFVLNPHPMEEITRHLLHFNDECPSSGSGSSFDVPAHFYSSMDAICKRLLRVVKETSHLLKEATNNFVLSNATDEDREVARHPQGKPADIADASTAMGETDSFFRSTTGHFRDTTSAFRDTHNGFRDTGLTFKSGCSFTEVSICEVPAPATGPKEDMLETILAEHNNLPEKMKQELDEFVADLESRRKKDEKKIGLLSVMQKTSTFRHDPDFRNDQWLDSFTATASE